MKNKNIVPVIEQGPNKSLVIHHGDLDGYNGAQVCQKWLEENLGHNHMVEVVKASYENVNPQAEAYFEIAKEFRYIMFVDISINEELASSAPENVYIFDHHDTSMYLLDMSSRYYWNEKYCGAVVAWQALFGNKKDAKFMKLMKICNQYDMWEGNDGEPPKLSFDMNALFWKEPKDWYKDFYDGFDGFTKDQQKFIDDFWAMQESLWENKIDKLTYSEDCNVIFLEVNDERWDANWWCNHLMRHEGINVVIVSRSDKKRISVRTSKERMDWFHSGEWLKENITNTNNSKGGHRHASGCSTDGMSDTEVLEIGEKLEKICQDHFKCNNKKVKHA